ncbi:MAG TPA: hypothetical protein PLY34_08850 [Ferruginibacter sp.]|nr:hypothetical protein [Ferruginibacter sp.]HPH90203.1 hypothetical protein [Ferruginibacter sp.]
MSLSCCMALSCFARDSAKVKLKEYPGVLTLTEKYKEEKNWIAAERGIVREHFKRLEKLKEEEIVVLLVAPITN